MNNLILTDISGAYIEHSTVITNFTSMVYSQIKASMCRVFPDNVQYKWIVDGEESKRQIASTSTFFGGCFAATSI